MRLALISTVAFGLSASATFAPPELSRFVPETGGLQSPKLLEPLPSQYSLSASQVPYKGDYINSYWTSSFIYGSDNHEYLVLSHILVASAIGVYRASILDITDPTRYGSFTSLTNATVQLAATELDLDFGELAFKAVSADPIGQINTFSTRPEAEFNLTFGLTAPAILNAGVGTFLWGNGITTNEWSMPAGCTTGNFKVNGTEISVVPEKSFTWYDRQWQIGSASNWTWFELHVSSGSASGLSRTKLSVWFYPSGDGVTKGFATIREQAGVSTVEAATFTETAETWTSPITNSTYALGWNVQLADGTSLDIATTRPDQELSDSGGVFATYEAYVDVEGSHANGSPLVGFGLVEVQPISRL